MEAVVPETPTSVVVTDTLGGTTKLDIWEYTVYEPISLVLVPDVVTFGDPDEYKLGDLSFDIQAYAADGTLIDDLSLHEPVPVTIHYLDEQIRVLDEATLKLFWWDGVDWADAACAEYVRDLANNILQVSICHFSSYALGGATHELFLPVIQK